MAYIYSLFKFLNISKLVNYVLYLVFEEVYQYSLFIGFDRDLRILHVVKHVHGNQVAKAGEHQNRKV